MTINPMMAIGNASLNLFNRFIAPCLFILSSLSVSEFSCMSAGSMMKLAIQESSFHQARGYFWQLGEVINLS